MDTLGTNNFPAEKSTIFLPKQAKIVFLFEIEFWMSINPINEFESLHCLPYCGYTELKHAMHDRNLLLSDA